MVNSHPTKPERRILRQNCAIVHWRPTQCSDFGSSAPRVKVKVILLSKRDCALLRIIYFAINARSSSFLAHINKRNIHTTRSADYVDCSSLTIAEHNIEINMCIVCQVCINRRVLEKQGISILPTTKPHCFALLGWWCSRAPCSMATFKLGVCTVHCAETKSSICAVCCSVAIELDMWFTTLFPLLWQTLNTLRQSAHLQENKQTYM